MKQISDSGSPQPIEAEFMARLTDLMQCIKKTSISEQKVFLERVIATSFSKIDEISTDLTKTAVKDLGAEQKLGETSEVEKNKKKIKKVMCESSSGA